MAQEKKEPKVKFNAFSVNKFVSGKRFKIDAAYGRKFNFPIAAPFTLIVPVDKKKFGAKVAYPPKASGAIVRFSFVSLGSPPNVLENIEFRSMRLRMAAPSERLKLAAKLLREQAFPALARGSQESKLLNIRKIKIGKLEAAEVIGRFTNASSGLVYVRLVGIPNPNSIDGIFSVARVVGRYTSIKKPGDFVSKSQGGRALTTFKYLK